MFILIVHASIYIGANVARATPTSRIGVGIGAHEIEASPAAPLFVSTHKIHKTHTHSRAHIANRANVRCVVHCTKHQHNGNCVANALIHRSAGVYVSVSACMCE